MRPDLRILAVPNEDGFGPSALLSYVVKELLRRWPDCHVTIWNQSRRAYNENLYGDSIRQGRVEVVPVWNLIQLHKDAANGGAISLSGTLRQIGDYRSASDRYPLNAASADFDLVLDFGVPAAARWASLRGFPSVTVFDHSWAKTLEMILADADKQPGRGERLSNADRELWCRLISDIKADEMFTRRLYLFPEFVTPEIFLRHWQHTIGGSSIHRLAGVLGGRPTWTEADARKCLGLSREGSILMLQAGDTPVWAHLLRKLVPAFLSAAQALNELQLNVVIYVPGSLTGLPEVRRLYDAGELAKCLRVRAFSPVPGSTIQAWLPFVRLLVTRAGGGTVNDAIACRTPFLCVPESTQSQVQAIHEACVKQGFTRTLLLEAEAANDPVATILEECRNPANQRLADKMKKVPVASEQDLVHDILKSVRE